MNKWLKNHAKLEKLKRDINAQNAKKTKLITYNSILNNLRIGWSDFLFLSKNKKVLWQIGYKKHEKLAEN